MNSVASAKCSKTVSRRWNNDRRRDANRHVPTSCRFLILRFVIGERQEKRTPFKEYPMPSFMLIARDVPQDFADVSPEDMQRIIEKTVASDYLLYLPPDYGKSSWVARGS